jgi:hypothetical protein
MTTSRLMSSGRLLFRSLKTLNSNATRILFILVCVDAIMSESVAAQVPVVTIDSASDVSSTAATINGTVNPNGLQTAFHVIYGPTTAYGYTGYYAPLTPQNTAVSVTNRLTGLNPNTTYHCQLVATNGAGQGASVDMTFTTLPAEPPSITVGSPTSITSSNAVVSGTLSPNGASTGYYVQWGLTTGYGSAGPGSTVPADTNMVTIYGGLVGLSANTTYHYRFVATNSAGTTYSADTTLTTLPPPPPQAPTVTTGNATTVTASNATITGIVNANGLATGYYFQWGTTAAYGNVTPTISLPAQWTPLDAYADLMNLSPATTYHYRMVATNSVGITSGADREFTTLGLITIDGHTFGYSVSNAAITITSYSGPGGNVTIPSYLSGLPVTSIGDNAFWSAPLTGVSIPDSVTSIGYSAFADCRGLTNVTIPDSVTYLGDTAFGFCDGIVSLTIGKGITTIRGGGDRGAFGTFEGLTSLTRLVIPDNVTNITDGPLYFGGALGAFYFCSSLTNVIIGKGLSYLGVGAFSWCTNLLGLYFQGNAPTPGENGFGQDIFHWDNLATVYYLPGTTGWGPTYAGLPTMLWNAQVPSGYSSVPAGPGTNKFGFKIAGTPGIPIVIEANSNNLTGTWILLQSCTLTNGLVEFVDPQPMNLPMRFYRVRSP